MRILLDECVPRQLGRELLGHEVQTVAGMGWAGIKNGRLLELAEGEFDVLLTVDRRIPFQQNLAGRRISLLIITARGNRLSTLQQFVPAALEAFENLEPGMVVQVGP